MVQLHVLHQGNVVLKNKQQKTVCEPDQLVVMTLNQSTGRLINRSQWPSAILDLCVIKCLSISRALRLSGDTFNTNHLQTDRSVQAHTHQLQFTRHCFVAFFSSESRVGR